jgi:aminoglycoside phosphotransferase family enzyme/predicted kinase
MTRRVENPVRSCDESSIVSEMKCPETYEHAVRETVERVEHLETHISHLFFAASRVFKLKKHLTLDFLDYSTPERRRHLCDEEVRLNRHLAPEVYLGTVPVTVSREHTVRVEGQGEPIAWAVKMVRLPSERMLAALLDRDALEDRHVDTLVETLARFHAEAATGESVDEHGTPQAVAAKVRNNLRETRESVERGLLSNEQHRLVSRWALEFIDGRRDLLERRVREGRIREGHGDLHAGNVCFVPQTLSPAGIAIYDCIEFSRELRCCDVASDIAFLAMDLDRRGQSQVSDRLVARYVERTQDAELFDLLDLYKCHRAVVRAKVTALEAHAHAHEEEEVDDAKERSRAEARGYLQLAASYALPPMIVLTCGLPGTGKSWLVRRLAGPLGAVVLRSDVIRKRLAGLDPGDSASADFHTGLYDEPMTRRTYQRLRERVVDVIRSGRTAIVDATFSTRGRRAPFVRSASEEGVPLRLLHVTAPHEVVRERLERRSRGGTRDASDADVEIYRRARRRFEPPDELRDRRVPFVSGTDTTVELVDRLLEHRIDRSRGFNVEDEGSSSGR